MPLPKHLKRPHKRVIGEPPGTLSPVPDAPPPTVQVIAFGPDRYVEADVTDIESLPEYVAQWPVTWINVYGLGDVELVQRIGELFALHPLALEDVFHMQQRSKVDEYDEHLFFVIRMIRQEKIDTEQMGLFLGKNYIITIQEQLGDPLDPIRKRIREGRGRVRTMPADYLAYCLLDAVIDAYYPHVDGFSDRIEHIEDEVLNSPTPDTLAAIHQLRRDLLTVRRSIAPLRDAIMSLLHGGYDAEIRQQTRVYLRDSYDHTVQILDLVENYREIASGLIEIYLSSVSNRMNEIMKVLTVIATIFIPLSFVTGIYGMNFDPEVSRFNMPELGWRLGYPFFWLVAGAVVGVEMFFFWRRGWLSSATTHPAGTPDKKK